MRDLSQINHHKCLMAIRRLEAYVQEKYVDALRATPGVSPEKLKDSEAELTTLQNLCNPVKPKHDAL
jgi:hypothetical protein